MWKTYLKIIGLTLVNMAAILVVWLFFANLPTIALFLLNMLYWMVYVGFFLAVVVVLVAFNFEMWYNWDIWLKVVRSKKAVPEKAEIWDSKEVNNG